MSENRGPPKGPRASLRRAGHLGDQVDGRLGALRLLLALRIVGPIRAAMMGAKEGDLMRCYNKTIGGLSAYGFKA